jgi:hypothetical protein
VRLIILIRLTCPSTGPELCGVLTWCCGGGGRVCRAVVAAADHR